MNENLFHLLNKWKNTKTQQRWWIEQFIYIFCSKLFSHITHTHTHIHILSQKAESGCPNCENVQVISECALSDKRARPSYYEVSLLPFILYCFDWSCKWFNVIHISVPFVSVLVWQKFVSCSHIKYWIEMTKYIFQTSFFCIIHMWK
jgi:hypothetical protein